MTCRKYNRNNSTSNYRSYLTVVAINCAILFHTYLLVPCQGFPPAMFSSGSPSHASSEFSSEFSFLNLKAEPRISESHEDTVEKLDKSIHLVVSHTGSIVDVHYVSYSSFFTRRFLFRFSIILSCRLLNPASSILKVGHWSGNGF